MQPSHKKASSWYEMMDSVVARATEKAFVGRCAWCRRSFLPTERVDPFLQRIFQRMSKIMASWLHMRSTRSVGDVLMLLSNAAHSVRVFAKFRLGNHPC
jgi:hypothetical protein